MAKILLVEDNPASLKLAEFLLARAGHEVLKAMEAGAGLALARSERPDLVLMDVQLPGMDGLAATRELRSGPATRNLKVIALTALAMKGDKQRILAAGCDGYIAKPYDYKVFLAEIERHLGAATIRT